MSTAWVAAEDSAAGVMVKEIPIPLVRANQILLILGNVVALATGSYWVVTALFVAALASLLFGPRANLAFRIARPLLGSRLFYAPSESIELQRFNQLIAATCMALATSLLWLTGHWLGWLFVVFVVVAATAAVLGYCVGCQIYYPYKLMVRRLRATNPRLAPLFDFVAGEGPFRPPLQERPHPLMLMGLAHEAMRAYATDIEAATKALTPAALPALRRAVEEMLQAIEQHAQQEDLAMYPPFERKLKGITRAFSEEHEAIHAKANAAVLETLNRGARATRRAFPRRPRLCENGSRSIASTSATRRRS